MKFFGSKYWVNLIKIISNSTKYIITSKYTLILYNLLKQTGKYTIYSNYFLKTFNDIKFTIKVAFMRSGYDIAFLIKKSNNSRYAIRSSYYVSKIIQIQS